MHHERVIFFGRPELARSQPVNSHRNRPGCARRARQRVYWTRMRTPHVIAGRPHGQASPAGTDR
jgi:hypothetical protein